MNKSQFKIKYITEKLEKLTGKKVVLKENYIDEESYNHVDFTEDDVLKMMTIINSSPEIKNLIRRIVDKNAPEEETY